MIRQSTERGKARRPGLGSKLHLSDLWDTLEERSSKHLDTLIRRSGERSELDIDTGELMEAVDVSELAQEENRVSEMGGS